MRKAWFRPRAVGVGYTPNSWEGWAITIAFVAILAVTVVWLRPMLEQSTGLPQPAVMIAIVGVWLVFFFLVAWLTSRRGEQKP